MTAPTVLTERKKTEKEAEKKTLDAHDQKLWRADIPTKFSESDGPEPHAARRREIINKHPEIQKLMRPDPLSAVFCLCTIAVQLVMAYLVRDMSWTMIFILAYCIGGFMNHSLVLAMHELSHDLWFTKRWMNSVMAFIANCPTCVASACTFKRYHLEHHSFQGSNKWDADLPSALEGILFRYTPTKIVWVFLQALMYGLRPVIVKPKAVTKMEIANWVVVGGFDLLVLHFLGGKSLVYLFASSILGLGIHPMSGHFIAEHFEFIKGQETYSYYGPLNYLAYNVGYHNEHHDFPKVPGRLLPEITKIAPEYYLNMPYYDSWCKVLWGFMFNGNMNCYCRIARKP